ncbi:MAG: C4-dicarboxylate ABC transporter permease [Gemmatimonadales bacterium]|nr:hypothetical protein HRbin33_01317 [bacterium HR33]GIW52553.1 MAG: C4-dicarboxylate ABC transporter permease [Gemmatimonadales bacterium]
MRPLDRLEAALERTLQVLVIGLMLALAAVVVIGVVFRKAGAALSWYDEIAATLLAWLTYYGASLAALRGAHLGFPKIKDAFPRKLRVPLLVIREAVIVTFLLLVAWAGWKVLVVLEGHYLVTVPWLPARITQSVIPIGAVLFILAELVHAARSFKTDADS